MRTAALVLAVLVAAPAFAEDEAPQATAAPATPAPSVADQIADYLRTSPVPRIEGDGVEGVTARDDRQAHGEVVVGIGTGGYRSFYMRSDMPVGESGRLSVAFADTRNARWGGHRGVGADLRFGGPGLDRQRCDIEGMTPPRPLDSAFGGPNGRCVRPLVP